MRVPAKENKAHLEDDGGFFLEAPFDAAKV